MSTHAVPPSGSTQGPHGVGATPPLSAKEKALMAAVVKEILNALEGAAGKLKGQVKGLGIAAWINKFATAVEDFMNPNTQESTLKNKTLLNAFINGWSTLNQQIGTGPDGKPIYAWQAAPLNKFLPPNVNLSKLFALGTAAHPSYNQQLFTQLQALAREQGNKKKFDKAFDAFFNNFLKKDFWKQDPKILADMRSVSKVMGLEASNLETGKYYLEAVNSLKEIAAATTAATSVINQIGQLANKEARRFL